MFWFVWPCFNTEHNTCCSCRTFLVGYWSLLVCIVFVLVCYNIQQCLCAFVHIVLCWTLHICYCGKLTVAMATAIVRTKLGASAFNCAALDLAVASKGRTTIAVLCDSSSAWTSRSPISVILMEQKSFTIGTRTHKSHWSTLGPGLVLTDVEELLKWYTDLPTFSLCSCNEQGRPAAPGGFHSSPSSVFKCLMLLVSWPSLGLPQQTGPQEGDSGWLPGPSVVKAVQHNWEHVINHNLKNLFSADYRFLPSDSMPAAVPLSV